MATPETRVPLLPEPNEPMSGAPTPSLDMERLRKPEGTTMLPDGSAIVELEEDERLEVEEQDDGSALVTERDDTPPAKESKEFLENLAETMDPAKRARLATELLEAIKRDRESRTERDDLYAEGLSRTGATKETPGGANFQGASKVVHPMLMEACVDFAARTMKEVFPAKGPVKMHIVGKSSRAKIEKAQRKKDFMNWQATTQIRELRPAFEQMLTQVPLGGSQYLKAWHDERYERPRVEFVPVDMFHLPYAAVDLRSAERKTHEQRVTRMEFESRVTSGLYRESTRAGLGGAGQLPDQTAAEKVNEGIEGKSDVAYNEDGLRTVYESYAMLDLEGEDPIAKPDRPVPYIVSLDDATGELLAVYRNWEEDDECQEELDWVVEAKFLPWRGPQGIGIMHIAGSLSIAATGALRALLDSAHVDNFPGGLKMKAARSAGQTVSADPTQFTEVEGPAGVDDIRKLVMPYPFKGPSPVLFELLKFMAESGRGVINTAEEKMADATANAPVGTTLAMIEQGSMTYSSIHGRMHETMRQFLSILHRLDRDFLTDKYVVEELGDLEVTREDFAGPMDVAPVSDPNIFSETQRYAQLQAVMQLRAQFAPGSFNDPSLLERSLQLLNYPGYEDVVNTPLEAEELDPLAENVTAREPKVQLKAYEGQDHLAHLKAHVTFMASPIFCMNKLMAPIALPKLLEHCKEHLIMYYRENVAAAAKAVAAAATDFELNTEADVIAAASGVADKQMADELGPIFEQLNKMQEAMAQLLPPPPDPEAGKEQIKAQSAQAIEKIKQEGENARFQQRTQAEAQSAQAAAQVKAQSEIELAQLADAAAQRKEQAEAARHTEEMAIAADNARIAEESERRKQDREAQSKEFREHMETMRNTQDNQTKILIEKLAAMNERVIAAETAAVQARTASEATAAKPRSDAADPEDNELLMDALVNILTAQSTPREYEIQRGADGGLKLVSKPGSAAMNED